MKIAHLSDCHSVLKPIPSEADLVTVSGDFLPNHIRGFYGDQLKIKQDQRFQQKWLELNMSRIKNWIGKRPFIFSSGNHDFIDPTIMMRAAGIDAHCVDLKRFVYDGITFYGFPFIPKMDGEWNYECDPTQMGRRIAQLRDELQTSKINVLVAHCPPGGILDGCIVVRNEVGEITFVDQRDGNPQLTSLLSYIEEWNLPQYLLCGHFHPHYGVVEELGITISNAATTLNMIEVKNG